MERAYFDYSDYFVFTLMLCASIAIGLYFAFFGSKKKTVDEYLLGSKQIKPIPVALSLVASSISAITLIGVPSEVYTVGPTYGLICVAMGLMCIVARFFFLPIYYDLNITSIYEYLELRFNRSIRSMTSIFYNVSYLLFVPSVLFLPSISLSQATGIDLHYVSIFVTSVCVFYTMIGGIKAVVWTDFLQTIISIGACYLILILGTIDVGGISHVFKVAYDDGKLDLNFDPNPFQRTSFWINAFGPMMDWSVTLGGSQSTVQRFMSLSSSKHVNLVLFMYWLGYSLFTLGSVYGGLLLYAAYYACDPIENKVVDRADQIYPYFVLDRIGYVPALPGLFIAGVLSAALSTLSTALNTIAGSIYEDFIKRKTISDSRGQTIMKCIIVAIGLYSIGMIFVIENMGKIISASYSITSFCYASVGVLFLLGMLIPWANVKGAFCGALSCACLLIWVGVGANVYKVNNFKNNVYPSSANTCPMMNSTMEFESSSATPSDDVFFLYRLSFLLYVCFGVGLGLTVGTLVSFLTGPTDPASVNPRLISPPLRRFLPKNNKYWDDFKTKQALIDELKIATPMKTFPK